MEKYEGVFDRTLGDWNRRPASLDLKKYATPYHTKAYPTPHVYDQCLRKEVERLISIGVLARCSDSEWVLP